MIPQMQMVVFMGVVMARRPGLVKGARRAVLGPRVRLSWMDTGAERAFSRRFLVMPNVISRRKKGGVSKPALDRVPADGKEL
ncbi:hypothetical protein GCM10007920_22690 [Ciceribacter naphthalenivorans]|uniref:Uncharacterized protein n=2 Tax=Alphaproteobacteria TaxID=28211 RepID=A0A512HGD8_9HYPH|nr:hypothetical protein RNA01_14510 [Ciceribacter naphthalenivorans]GLR22482.1 hypothetical protein GCM10007920_22690 [Ciceribacter naphthalenivorans]GLT05338.1 hypothetical protein GCM10007926_22690 [Sphingomonas psychrolutea]